ncbi:glycoside hydrolase family 38 C-terminal domain-containing protein [Granulicella sp. S156]|uniref:alpha-mannosidase n=1 Tax=Granulicella sp. S156 TaxID=1747224 RepID=UPI00131BD50D|nr:glycoside hydrolase family 38 C-terminal domain-containing protein [Granulicella sp. S156]
MNLQFRQRQFRKLCSPFLVALAVITLCTGEATLAQRIGVTYSADAQTDAALKSLSPGAQAVMTRLSKIGSLPIDDLRYYEGDLPNGASVNLDDSSWKTIKMPFTASADAIWLRRWIEVPKTFDGYSPAGAKIWLQARSRGGVTIYTNGQRVARGEDMEPIVLFDSAKPGDKLLLAVRFEKTAAPKKLRSMELHVDFASNRPNPKVLYTEFLSAAILVPSLAAGNASAKDALEQSIAAVDLKALDAGNQEAFDASLNKATSDLEPIRKILGTATTQLTGNSHIDAAWLWPWTETVDVVKRTFGSAIQLMDEYPTYTYTQSAAQYNVWMADKYPDLNQKIKQRIDEGRWEVVGGMWVEPDLNMPDGESQARELLIGKRTFKDLYGVDVRIGWNPDSFGYNWQLPQIYKKSGIDYFVTQKMSWNETNQLPLKLFWWESPDGSKVLTYFPEGYGNTNFSPVRLANDFAHARKVDPGISETMDLYGVGDHGGGPTRALLDEGLQWMAPDRVVAKTKFGTAQSYFNEVQGSISDNSPVWNYETVAKGETNLPTPAEGKTSIPTWKDELYLEFHRGVFTTQSNHKRNMRESEELVLNAEKYASLAWLDGQPYPATELTDAWKKVVFNQFHDLAAGSGIGVIYKDAQKDYDDVRWATQEIASKSLDTLKTRIDTQTGSVPGSVQLLIVNPLGWERSGMIEADVQMPTAAAGLSVLDSTGHVLPSEILSSDKATNTFHLLIAAKGIPSLGYEVVRVVPNQRSFASDLKASETTIENSALKVTVDSKTGCITSLYDKKAQFETLTQNSCGNELIAFTDKPKMFDAWNIDADFEKSSTKLDKADSVQLVESGPLRAVIRVTHSWQSSKFVQDIVLYSGTDEVNVVNDIDWHETHVLLKAAFDLAASSPFATYEIPYGTIQRPTTRNNSWEDAKFEVPAIRWADLGDGQHGLSLINESKYGYDAAGHTLRISLLRSPTDPDPDADRGHHHFGFALYPHAGDWKQALTVRRGYEYNYKLQSIQVGAHTGTLPLRHSFVEVAAQNVVLTAVKKAEDNNALIFRFYEWAGKDGDVRIQIPKGATTARLANLLEQPEGSPLAIQNGDSVSVPTHPYEIVTVKVEYPAPIQ